MSIISLESWSKLTEDERSAIREKYLYALSRQHNDDYFLGVVECIENIFGIDNLKLIEK